MEKQIVAEWANRGKQRIHVYSDGSFRGPGFGGVRNTVSDALDAVERMVATGDFGVTMRRVY